MDLNDKIRRDVEQIVLAIVSAFVPATIWRMQNVIVCAGNHMQYFKHHKIFCFLLLL